MKKIKFITQHVNVDISSAVQERKETVLGACTALVERGVNDLRLDNYDAEISIKNGDVVIVTAASKYICKFEGEGEGEIYRLGLDGAELQKLGNSDTDYEDVKLLEGIVLSAIADQVADTGA